MSKNKFLKRLLALGIATVSAASVFGLAACNPDAGNEGGDDEGNNGGGGSTPTQLAAPTLALDATNKKITWNAVDHADGYTVYEKLTTATTDPTSHAVTACEYAITQTVAGTYEYYVVATSTSEDYTTSNASNKVEYEVTASTTTPDAENITVHFVTGKDGVTVPDQTIPNNSKATRPTDPVCEGFVFENWYTADTYTTVVDFDKNIVVRGGDDEISFYAKWRDASTYDIVAASPNVIIAEDFNDMTKADLQSYSGSLGGTPGIYVKDTADGENRYDIVKGQLVAGGDSKISGSNVYVYADFGPVKGVVEGYFEFQFNAEASGDGNSVNFYNGSSKVLEMIANGKTTNSKFIFKLEGVADTNAPTILANMNTLYKVYFKLDLSDNGKLTLKINDTTVYTDAPTGISAVSGMEIVTSDGGQRKNTIDNIAVAAEKATLAEYAAAKVSALTAKYNATTLNDPDLGNLGNDILAEETGLIAVHTGNINAATSFADVDSAYVAAVGAIEGQILVNAKENACSKIENYMPAGKTYSGAQLEALNAAKVAVKNDINDESADSVAKVKAALTKGYATLDAVEDDGRVSSQPVTVTVKIEGVEQTVSVSGKRVGDKLTKAELDTAVAGKVPAGKVVEGYYSNEDMTTAIEFGEEGVELTTETYNVYVKTETATEEEVEHTINATSVVDAGITSLGGSNDKITSEAPVSHNGFTLLAKIGTKVKGDSDESDYLSFPNSGIVAKFTTSADNMTFKIKFESSQANGSRSLTVSCPGASTEEGKDGQDYTYTFDYKTKNQELTITLGKAGEYTITTAGGEIKLYYMTYTNMEIPSAAATVSELEAILPESKHY